MKIFIFSTHNLWKSHLDTELELIQNHLDKKDEVFRFICNGDLPVCDANPTHSIGSCFKCMDMGRCGKRLLDGNIQEFPILNNNQSVREKMRAFSFSYNSTDDIKKLVIDNFDLGYAALSSVVSLLRDPAPDLNKNKEIIDLYIKSSAHVYFSAIEYIKKYKPDLVYIFNGRLAHVKPVFRAAQLLNVECYIHERGHSKDHYELFKNTTPHDIDYIVNRIKEAWEKAIPEEREKKGEQFYQERVAGEDQGWYSFTKDQQKGLLPEGWDESKRNIAIYNSSEDEFVAIGPGWENKLYKTQLEGIRRILTDCLPYHNIHFYLRIHPNLAKVFNADKATTEALRFPNLTLIPADSTISTYDLLFNCEKVIAFGSSVGIEAVYWGKPSIQAGKSFYYDLDVTYKPSSHEELIRMISERLEPMSKIPALMYGHYFKTYGIKFKNYKATGFFKGTYKGVDLSESITWRTKIFNALSSKTLLWRIPGYIRIKFEEKRKKYNTY